MSCRRSSLLSALFALLVLIWPLASDAAPEPNYLARLTAAYHIQLQVLEVTKPETYPGECVLTGNVVRVFRNRGERLEEGDMISFPVLCTVETEEFGTPRDMPDANELAGATYVEMYLNPGEEEEYAMAEGQYMVIMAPTDEPLCESERAGTLC